MSIRGDDGRRTPPGSPPKHASKASNGSRNGGSFQQQSRRRVSSGFLYPTVGVSGAVSSRIVYYDGDIGLMSEETDRAEGTEHLHRPHPGNGSNGISKRPSMVLDKRQSNGSVSVHDDMAAHRRISSAKASTIRSAFASNGPSPPRTRHELESAKRSIDNKNREIDALRAALESAKTEAARRASQARVFREGDTALRTEISLLQEQLKAEAEQLQIARVESTKLKSRLTSATAAITNLRRELSEKSSECTQLRAALQTSSTSVSSLKESLQGSLKRMEEATRLMKEDKATIKALSSDISSYRAREEALERTIDAQSRALQAIQGVASSRAQSATPSDFGSDSGSIKEVLVQVGLPGGRVGEFLVRLDRGEDPSKAAQMFAAKYRLNDTATRLLTAFAVAECRVPARPQ